MHLRFCSAIKVTASGSIHGTLTPLEPTTNSNAPGLELAKKAEQQEGWRVRGFQYVNRIWGMLKRTWRHDRDYDSLRYCVLSIPLSSDLSCCEQSRARLIAPRIERTTVLASNVQIRYTEIAKPRQPQSACEMCSISFVEALPKREQ